MEINITQGEWKVNKEGRNIIIWNRHNRPAGTSDNEVAVIPEVLIGTDKVKYHISREQAEANAEGIVKAINNTYGLGMNPESVPVLWSAMLKIRDVNPDPLLGNNELVQLRHFVSKLKEIANETINTITKK